MALDKAREQMELYAENIELVPLIEDGYFQVGTLGGGNHFIELQVDEEGYLGIMIHSGSRHLGKEICDYFHNQARALNVKWHSAVPEEYRLAFLPVDTHEGQQYIHWMNLALDYAYENRQKMMERTMEIVSKYVEKYAGITVEYGTTINCHHNYASLEHHFDKDVVLGKHKRNDVAEECRFAYKDIDVVMENQKDLVKAVKKLKTVGVVKG